MIALVVVSCLFGAVFCQNVPTQVAFSVGLTHDTTILHAETVIYDKVFTNLGNGYNVTSGVFTAPMAGIYAFQFHTRAHLDKSTWLELYRNDAYLESIYGHTTSDYASSGNSIVQNLKKGDTMYVKAVDNQYGVDTNIYGKADQIYCTFSGYMLAPVFSETPTVG